MCSTTPSQYTDAIIFTVGQLPQTAYQSLLTPYAYFGLGRTNNYIENLFVGSTKHTEEHYINMEGVIPNSKLVIIPPIGTDDSSWRKELYLRPGEWIPWVLVTVVAATVVLAIIVFVLHLSEKVRSSELLCQLLLMSLLTARRRTRETESIAPYQFRCIVTQTSPMCHM